MSNICFWGVAAGTAVRGTTGIVDTGASAQYMNLILNSKTCKAA